MKWLLLFLFSSSSAFAQLDYSAETLFRHYPLAVFLKGQVGYGVKIWDKSGPQKEFLYGYTRAALMAQTSGTLQSYNLEFHLAPISIFDLYVGTGSVIRMSNSLPTFDCDQVVCKDSNLSRQYIGVRNAMAFGPYYLMNDWRMTYQDPSKNDRVFADELSSLLGSAGRDILTQDTALIGYKFDPEYSVGVLNQYNVMKNFANSTNMAVLFARREWKEWSALLGPGMHHDRNNHTHPTFLFNLKWTGNKGVTLF